MPEFGAIEDLSARKAAFFEYLAPFAIEANERIAEEREEIERLRARWKSRGHLKDRELDRLNEHLQRYALDAVDEATEETFRDLLSRADIVPPSMALAQAAIESGWGTSRFAQEGNNLYGTQCYEPGCGIVPKRRPKGRKFEVRKYRSPRESFEDYIHNLNTHSAYLSMRAIRRELRAREEALTGETLARGLERYSELGWKYVSRVQGVIGSNRLGELDRG